MNVAGSTMAADVDPTLAARAEIARLSLAVRTARREAEDREQRVAEEAEQADRAQELLAQGLAELIENRRRECERDLAVRRAAVADRAASRAACEAARIAAPALQVTGEDDALDEVAHDEAASPDRSDGELGDAEAAVDEVAVDEAAVDDVAVDEVAGRRRPEPEQDLAAVPVAPARLSVVGGSGPVPVPHPAFADDAPDPAASLEEVGSPGAAPAGALTVAVDPDELRALIHDAVAAGLREAMEHAVATMHLVPGLVRQAPVVASRPERIVAEVVDDRPTWRGLLHLDVLLPLLAALIVIVLFFAWMG